MFYKYLLFVLLTVFWPLGSIAGAGEAPAKVFVSVLPQKFFIEQISGDFLDVEVMVRPGASPATYEPKSSQMRKLADSAAYFSIGVPFENAWLDRIAGVNHDMKLVRTDEGILKVAMDAEHHHEEEAHEEGHHEGHEDAQEEGHGQDHGDHGDIHGEGLDPHIWLSPVLVKQQVENITEGLCSIYPGKAQLFRENAAAFITQIDALDKELHNLLEERQGMKFMVFHPSWGYFARAYGLEQIAIEIEGKSPKPAQLKELIHHAREEGIKVIFAQPQFSVKSAKLIAGEIGGTVIFIDPLAENWLVNMREAAGEIKKVLQ